MAEARQKIELLLTFRKSNKSSRRLRAGSNRSQGKKTSYIFWPAWL